MRASRQRGKSIVRRKTNLTKVAQTRFEDLQMGMGAFSFNLPTGFQGYEEHQPFALQPQTAPQVLWSRL
jgi:hypothetical protein